MNKKMIFKRVLSLFLAICLTLGLVWTGDAIQAEAEDNVTETNMEFVSGNSNNDFYVFQLRPEDDSVVLADIESGAYTDVYLDKQLTSTAAVWLGGSASAGYYELGIHVNQVESGKTPAQIGAHVLQIPAGTVVGNIRFADDVYILINGAGDQAKELHSTSASFLTNGFNTKYNWYSITLQLDEEREKVTEKPYSSTIYVDGKEVPGGMLIDSSYCILIRSYNIQEECYGTANMKPHVVTIPKGTYFGDVILANDVHLKIHGSGSTITELHPTKASFASNGYNSNYTWFSINLNLEEERPIVEESPYSSTIYVDGVEVPEGMLIDGSYCILIRIYNIQAGCNALGNLKSHIVTIPKGTYFGDRILLNDVHLQTSAGSSVLTQIYPTYTDVTTDYNRQSGARGENSIYIDTSSDELTNGLYAQSAFTEGGITVDGEYLEGVTIQKVYNGRYCINLDAVADSLKEGSIVTLEGTLTHVITHVTFEKISFIRNVDGSFSSYHAEEEAVAAETVALDDVWVNVDKFGSYDIASVPLLKGGKAEYQVNNATPSSTILTETGDYEITRVLGNAILADTVGNELGDITYTQTAHLYKTGDANGDGKLSVADIVRQKIEAGTTENVVKGKTDLNYDSAMNDADRVLLVDLMLGNKTAEDIYNADASIVFGAISDTHYLSFGSDGQNRINTRKALNYYKSQNAEVIILNGDITDFGEAEAYQKLVEDIVAVYPDENTRPTIIFTGDNHEWYGAWTVNGMVPAEGVTFESLQNLFNTELGSLRGDSNDTNSYYEVNGYHFIGVSSDGMHGGQCTYDSDTIEFVTEKLAAANSADSNKPIFLAIHQAPPNTVYGSDGLDCFYSTEMEALLKQYPNLVVITSHTHAPLQSEKSISQSDFTTLNTASLYYVGGTNGMDNLVSGQLGDIYQFGQGLLIRANGKDVDVERYDFYNDEKIKENWTFTAGDNTKYTAERADEATALEFAEDASVVAEWIDDTSVKLTFDAVEDKENAVYYQVNVYEGELNVANITKKVSSMYWKTQNEMPETFTVTITGLVKTQAYKFEVKAMDCWENESAPISTSHKAEAAKTVKVKITGINAESTKLWYNNGNSSFNQIYLTTDVTTQSDLWNFYTDTKYQIHHYHASNLDTDGVSSDICWSNNQEIYIQSYTEYLDGDVVILPKGMTFTIGGINYELAETYRMTCSGGTTLTGETGADPIPVTITGFLQWSNKGHSFYLTTDYYDTEHTWEYFFDNGANLYYGSNPVDTAISFTAGGPYLFIQNGTVEITDGTVITIPAGFTFSQCGVLHEIENTTLITRVGDTLTVEVLPNTEVDVDELLDTKHTLRADANGDFKVLVLSDVQSNSTVLEEDIQDNIKLAVDKEQPDLVLFGGDNSYGMDSKEKLRSYLNGMVGYLEEQKIPWAHVFGNHDDENKTDLVAISKEEQEEVYEEFDYCVSKAGDSGLSGVGNYVLPVLNHNNDKIAFNVWCLDSGSYLETAGDNVHDGDNVYYGHYDYIRQNQIDWYTTASQALEEYNGAEIPAMMLFHIPLQENYKAWAVKETEGLTYTGKKTINISSAAVNSGLFDAVVERGDVKAIVNGHDHENDYMVEYKDVMLCASSTVTTVAVNEPTILGGRVVTFSATADKPVQTYMSYIYEEIPETPDVETVKVKITGVDGTNTKLWTSDSNGNYNDLYLTTDVAASGSLSDYFRDKDYQIQHYHISDKSTDGVLSEIGWSESQKINIKSYTQYADGDVLMLPKGMTFTCDGVTYELAETYRLTCSGGTTLTGATGDDPIPVTITGVYNWSNLGYSFYLYTDHTQTENTWIWFRDNGANLYYGATPVSTTLSFTGETYLFVQNGSALFADGTSITIPKGFRFSQAGVLYEIAKTAVITREGDSLKVEVLP